MTKQKHAGYDYDYDYDTPEDAGIGNCRCHRESTDAGRGRGDTVTNQQPKHQRKRWGRVEHAHAATCKRSHAQAIDRCRRQSTACCPTSCSQPLRWQSTARRGQPEVDRMAGAASCASGETVGRGLPQSLLPPREPHVAIDHSLPRAKVLGAERPNFYC